VLPSSRRQFSSVFFRYYTTYSGRKITESLGNVTVRRGKYGKSKRGARWPTVCLSMYSITENIYYSQLTAPLRHFCSQNLTVSHCIVQGKHCALSPNVLSSFGLPLSTTCLLATAKEARSYFASTITSQKSHLRTLHRENLKSHFHHLASNKLLMLMRGPALCDVID
jgi:hypothetical protein